MDDKKNSEIRQVLEHFKDIKDIPHKTMEEFCTRKKFEVILPDDFVDYRFQREYDQKLAAMYPEILKALAEWKYIPEFLSEAESKKRSDKNDDIRMAIIEVMEEHAIPYTMMNISAEKLGNEVQQLIVQAGLTISNKTVDVFMQLAIKQFGEKPNSKNVGEFIQKVYDEALKKRKNTEEKVKKAPKQEPKGSLPEPEPKKK